jgi:hypothetical protein
MKLSFITVALATLITTVFGQVELSGTPTSVLTEGTTGVPAWPALVRFVPELTNAERIQRYVCTFPLPSLWSSADIKWSQTCQPAQAVSEVSRRFR